MFALFHRSAIAAALVFSLGGCGMGSGGTEMTGTVTFDGKPIEMGQIVFEPQGPGRMAVAPVRDGRYQINATQAPTTGVYLVRITAERLTDKQGVTESRSLEDQIQTEEYEQYLPAKYNSQSELNIELTDSSGNTHDFALTSN